MAVLATGKDALIGLVGPEVVRQAQAFHKFPGDNREKARSSWDLYCYNKDGAWIVGCLDERQNRKSQFQFSYAIERAHEYKDRLDAGEKPWQPNKVVDNPISWVSGGDRLAIDFEGWDRIERISLANDHNILVMQWSPQLAHWLRSELPKYKRILAHNFTFELNMLEHEGFVLDEDQWHCTMACHQVLFPWRDDGLGKCAPLYVMTVPFKHMFSSDMETYEAFDAGLLLEMDTEMQRLMDDRRCRRAYELQRLQTLRVRRFRGRLVSAVGGKRDALTRAAGALEWKPVTNGRLPGDIDLYEPDITGCDVLEIPLEDVVERLTGEPVRSIIQTNDEIARRHMLGYGVRTIRNGVTSKSAPRLPRLDDSIRDEQEFVTQHRLELWDDKNPAFVSWRELIRKQASRDGYVSTFTGRRIYGFREGEAQRALIWATQADMVREAMEARPGSFPGERHGEYICPKERD